MCYHNESLSYHKIYTVLYRILYTLYNNNSNNNIISPLSTSNTTFLYKTPMLNFQPPAVHLWFCLLLLTLSTSGKPGTSGAWWWLVSPKKHKALVWVKHGKTMPFAPPMTGNGKFYTYKNGDDWGMVLSGMWPMALLKTHFWMNLRGDLWVTFQSSMSLFGWLKKMMGIRMLVVSENDDHFQVWWWEVCHLNWLTGDFCVPYFSTNALFGLFGTPGVTGVQAQWISRRSDTTAVNRGACFKVLPESMKEPIPIHPNPLETFSLVFIMFRHVSPWSWGNMLIPGPLRANPIPVQSSAEPFISASGTCPGSELKSETPNVLGQVNMK